MKPARSWPWPSLVAVVLGALSTAIAPSAARAAWSQPSGGPLDVVPAANAGSPSIASVDGVPYAAWAESSAGHSQIFVKRLEGTTWVQVGGSLNVDTAEDALDPDITSVDGVPFVAWLESSAGHEELYVKRLIAGDWVPAGDHPLNLEMSSDAAHPSIVSVAGAPYVAWDEERAGGHSLVWVARFDGDGWVPPGPNEFRPLNQDTGEDAQSPKLADVDGVPYVVWSESNGRQDLAHVRRFDGAGFVPIGSDPLNLSSARDAVTPSIAPVDGVPYVAWSESDGVALQIDVKRLSGSDWTTVGGSLNVNPAEDASAPTVASVGGAPSVVWQEFNGPISQIRSSRFDGTSWRALGGPLNVDPSQDAQFIDPALIDVGGVPYVTWEEAHGMTLDVRVKRLEPDILAERATPSAGGATLMADVNDFGMPLPVGFEYGAGAFSAQTPLLVSSGVGVSTITAALGGLAPGTNYVYRAFGSDTFRETSQGPTASFSTPAVSGGITGGPVRGRITGLELSPSTFSAARRGASIAARIVGTIVSYIDSQAATTTFTVQRATTGRRVAGRCVATSRRNRTHGRCTRYPSVGSFTHADTAGANQFRFTGRAGGRMLAPGRYRLQAIPHNVGGSGPPAYRNFEVER